jgi:hypothetical protein
VFSPIEEIVDGTVKTPTKEKYKIPFRRLLPNFLGFNPTAVGFLPI